MIHGVFAAKERRRQIVQAILNFHLQVWVRQERLNQVTFDVRRAGKPEIFAGTAMLPVPIVAGFVRARGVDLILAEFQLLSDVAVQSGDESSGSKRVLRVVFRVFTE